jgi:MAF protein
VNLVLASTSRYRADLLARLRLPFTTADPALDETPHPGEAADGLTTRLAEAKARAVADRHPDALVIGSDQVATLDGRIMGKPGGRAAACAQLASLSGRRVEFVTGVAVVDVASGLARVDRAVNPVTFRALTRIEIEADVDAEQPFDCAGAFRSEGLGVALFDAVGGDDPSALIGLPLIRLCALLRAFGVNPLLP